MISPQSGIGKLVIEDEEYRVEYKITVSKGIRPRVSGSVKNLDTETSEKQTAFGNCGGRPGKLFMEGNDALEISLNNVNFLEQTGRIVITA